VIPLVVPGLWPGLGILAAGLWIALCEIAFWWNGRR
jgi:hypothetical protein